MTSGSERHCLRPGSQHCPKPLSFFPSFSCFIILFFLCLLSCPGVSWATISFPKDPIGSLLQPSPCITSTNYSMASPCLRSWGSERFPQTLAQFRGLCLAQVKSWTSCLFHISASASASVVLLTSSQLLA